MRLDKAPSYLSFDQLQVEIQRYTYRPGWVMTVFQDPWEGPCFYLAADVQDAYDPGKTVQLRIRSNIPQVLIRTPEDFGLWIQWRLSQVESHEAREYLRRDGQILYDPHDPVEPDWP